jgi:DNA-binding XRE family transcriptional regulator
MKFGTSTPAKPMSQRPAGAVALHDRRVAAGLTMDTLARLSGIKKSSISKLESGAYQLTPYYLEKLTAAIESAGGGHPAAPGARR